MSTVTAITLNEVCTQIFVKDNENQKPVSPNKGGGKAIQINAPVGIGGANMSQDVITIQKALNGVFSADGGASPPLVVDGFCGQKTKNAIQQFQLKQFGWSGADGKINPGGQTIRRLNEVLGNEPAPNDDIPPVDDETANTVFKTAMTAGLLTAQRWIYAAQSNLDMALVVVDQPDVPGMIPAFGRAERMRHVNRYFKIDEMNPNQRRITLQRIRQVYSTMLQIFQRPGSLWGEKAFEIDSTGVAYKEASGATAHTDASGYFKGNQPNSFRKSYRADRIYFVRENIAYFMDLDRGVRTIVREMAHFCGDARTGWAIHDFSAYGEPETFDVSRLTMAERVRHADTYARFARTCGK